MKYINLVACEPPGKVGPQLRSDVIILDLESNDLAAIIPSLPAVVFECLFEFILSLRPAAVALRAHAAVTVRLEDALSPKPAGAEKENSVVTGAESRMAVNLCESGSAPYLWMGIQHLLDVC